MLFQEIQLNMSSQFRCVKACCGRPNPDTILHCSDVIMTMIASKSPASLLFAQPFVQAQIKENIKAPRQWPLCGEFTGDRWIPRTISWPQFPAPRASNAENVFIWWRHHDGCKKGAVRTATLNRHSQWETTLQCSVTSSLIGSGYTQYSVYIIT